MNSGSNEETGPDVKGADAAKRSCASVSKSELEVHRRATTSESFSRIKPSVVLLLLAASFALLHHIFYTHLKHKSLDPMAAELPKFLRNPGGVKLIGTIVAHATRVTLFIAISAIYTQIFWEKLRTQNFTMSQIDALFKCAQSPFHALTIRAAYASLALFLISFLAYATTLIVIITPGSLTVFPDFRRTSPCLVPSVPQSVLDTGTASVTAPLFDIPVEVLLSNSYLSPFRTNLAQCNNGASACAYNLSFVGPALRCEDVTNATDLSHLLHSDSLPLVAPTAIWYAPVELQDRMVGQTINMTIQSYDMTNGVLEATHCTAYRSTYEVGVFSERNSTVVHIWNTSLDSPLLVEDNLLSLYTRGSLDNFVGYIYAGPSGYVGKSYGIIQNSGLFSITSSGNHTWSGDIPHFLTSYVQNVSISLLSSDVHYRLNKGISEEPHFVDTTCSSTFTVYEYDSARLLLTYGVAFGISSLVVAYGLRLTLHNGSKTDVSFSDIIEIASEQLLSPSSSCQNDACDSVEKDADLSLKDTSKFGPVTYGAFKMATRIAAAFFCMATHHVYYRYLDGKSPSDSSGFFEERNSLVKSQTAVSDIGIALAYASQTFLVSAIYYASTQMIWRRIRSHDIQLSQLDALMRVQVNPFSPSVFFGAVRASPSVLLVSLLAALLVALSVITPGSIVLSDGVTHAKECTVKMPRNLTHIPAFHNSEARFTNPAPYYRSPIVKILSSGTYMPPLNLCPSESSGRVGCCSYSLEFVGPGLECEDVTTFSNGSSFTEFLPAKGYVWTNLFNASIQPQTDEESEAQVFIQSWDMRRSSYRAVNCSGVLRPYSLHVSHDSITSRIEVIDSRTIEPIPALKTPDYYSPTTFSSAYMHSILSTLSEAYIKIFVRNGRKELGVNFMMGNIGRPRLDGTFSWREDFAVALEEFAQNATLSLLSGRIFAFNPDDPDILEDAITTCNYKLIAYEYTPYRLFLSYGIALLFTTLCAIWGLMALKCNGNEESMEFSRFVRRIPNMMLGV
ncbi:hypothetical protein SCHPADRAFT_941026 [Schizopora paradoxa]|uniref:Uncharacterized protein n=1 Tax=Schizopora paradoxa TaxID=27342 RepID=A0A0H2S727_9AGAM|nr:hypothetical protein SCHPADRAFT_941026 [Schizopora paradoxa]